MNRVVVFSLVAAVTVLGTACNMGKIPPERTVNWQRWKKEGISPDDTRLAYEACKAKQPMAEDTLNVMHQCLLDQGFIYFDDPVRPFCEKSEWRNEDARMKWVVCRSLVKPAASQK